MYSRFSLVIYLYVVLIVFICQSQSPNAPKFCFLKDLFIYLFLIARVFIALLVAASRGYSPVVMYGLLTVVAPLVAEHAL